LKLTPACVLTQTDPVAKFVPDAPPLFAKRYARTESKPRL